MSVLTEKDLWFPNYIWSATLDSVDNTAIKEYGLKQIDKAMDDPFAPKERPWFTADNLVLDDCNALAHLKSIIDDCMLTVADEVGLHPVQLYNIWINKNPPGVANPPHTHTHHDGRLGAIFSGVYYVEADPELDQGDIVFERADRAEMSLPYPHIKRHTPYTAHQAQYKSSTNDLYIFSSWIPHRVTTNNSNKDRFSISFNYGV